MSVRGTGGRLLLLHLAALLAAAGVCRGGAARFYTTNTLTEAEPRLSGDYDSLLDQVSGDFGVRSEVVAAAGEEPEYRGAETMVVPLYIPKGAVPIKVARIARSDSRDPVVEVVDLTMSPAADSVLIRRIGPVEGRRGASPPNRAAWRARISRLPAIRRSDSVPRRRVASSSSSSSAVSPVSPASPVTRPLLPSSVQSEFGKRLASSLTTGDPIHTDTDTATKRAKKNELSKDSQFPDEFHTTAAPLTSPSSSPPASPERDTGIEATTRRFSTHLTSPSSTTSTTSSTTTSTTTTELPSSSSSTTTTTPHTTTTTTPATESSSSQTTTSTTTTTPTTPSSTTTTTTTATSTTTTTTPSTTKKATTTTTTTASPSTTTTTSSTATIQRITRAPSSTTTERRSILFPRPVETVLKTSRNTTPPSSPSVSSTSSPSTTTPKPTTASPTTTASTTTTTTTSTGGRSFSLPVRELPSWVFRVRTPTRRGSITTPPSTSSSTTTTTTTTTTSTTTTTERPHRVRDKLRRLSRLRTGLNKGSLTTPTSTSTTEKSQVTTPTTTTEDKAPVVTPRPSTATQRTSPVRMLPSVSEILHSRSDQEDDGHEDVQDTTLGRSATTEAYGKTSTTTLKSELEKKDEEEPEKGDEREVEKSQPSAVKTEGSVSQEKSSPSGATRKFVRRPRPSLETEKTEGFIRPSGHRRRRPLRPGIKLPPPITYYRASTAPPQESYASTSTTTTTTVPTTTSSTTTTTTTTQHPYRTTVTVTSPTTPKVVLTTTTTTTTTPPPTTTTTATTPIKTPEQVVIESLTEIMKQATNTSRSKDKVYNIAANLEDLNKRLAEQGIHIIHAEVDGVKIKLDNRTITRHRSPPVTTFRPPTALPASTLPTPRPSPASSSSSYSSFSPSSSQATTPNSQNKNVQTSIKSSFSFHTSLSPDTVNEVQTTTSDSEPTTTKPTEGKKTDDKPFLAPSRLPATEGENAAKNGSEIGVPAVPPVSTSGTRASLDLEGRQGASKSILATATVPATVTTRTRSTTVPVTAHRPSVTPSLSLHPATDTTTITTSTHEAEEAPPVDAPRAPTTVHPTSHHRPAYLPRPTDHSSATEGSETTETPTIKVVSILKAAEFPGPAATVEGVDGEDIKTLQDLKDSPRASYTAVYVISVIGVIPAAGLAFFIARRFLKKTQKALPESEERGEGFTPVTHHARKTQAPSHAPPMETESPSSVEAKNPRFTPWEFPRSKLRLVSILGQGNFGVVWKAEARDLCACEGSQGGPTVLVAVKGVKDGAGAKEKQDLLKELAIMQHLGQHINVVTLLGCCTQQEPYYVIMEYVMFGKLLTFLRDHRTRQNYYNFSSDTAALTSHDLTRFACQVAAGCEYIQSRGIIHRDLASRNVLVDHNKVCKIADFGLARSVKDLGSDIYEQKSRGALPIRWMAPESLYMSIFTHKSDVWSLGILCWEIVTLGSTPYPGMTAREVMRKVREGYRLERPEHCRPELYHVVTRCWHQDLNQRPSFTEIKEDLLELLDNSPTGYIDLENFPENSYYSMHENNDEKL